MKVKLLTTISFFTYQFGISQTEKLLYGKVISQNNALKNVEVINKTAKISTTTNALGEFSILANVKDSLIFFSKGYYFKRLKLTQNNLDQNDLVISMIIKPEELEEIVITNIKFPHVGAAKHGSTVNPSNSLQKYTGVYDGTIANGMDFIAMGGLIADLFKNEKEAPKKKTPQVDFKKLVATSIPESFFYQDLKLTIEQKALFLEFCDADPKSKIILEHSNILSTMDFLYVKNEEFKKLNSGIKN
ncbi:MAG: hypothetical protein RSD71_00540 [Flavobacterium sp.]|uniref:hypothetical protein n=1 Tax=Flavobacterium sp. TaxID=239 RepID=UPI002FCAEFC8